MSKPQLNLLILRLISWFKIVDGLLLLLVAIGGLRLLQHDAAFQIAQWAAALRVDPDNYFIQNLLTKLTGLTNRQLAEIAAGTLFYAALLLSEGIGLYLAKRWAEYLTVVATALFIPLEIYELMKSPNLAKGVALVINVAIVWYLAQKIGSGKK